MLPPLPFMYAADGAERARRRRMANHATTPAIKHAATTPPTTPPAITPAFEVLGEEVDDVDEGV